MKKFTQMRQAARALLTTDHREVTLMAVEPCHENHAGFVVPRGGRKYVTRQRYRRPKDSVKLLDIATRQFAKRQMTWWRGDPTVEWHEAESADLLAIDPGKRCTAGVSEHNAMNFSGSYSAIWWASTPPMRSAQASDRRKRAPSAGQWPAG